MRDADKNRDPERAKKRAVSDARCALRKLGLLQLMARDEAGSEPSEVLVQLCKALKVAEGDR